MPTKTNTLTGPSPAPPGVQAAVAGELLTPEVVQPVIRMVDDQRRTMNRVWMGVGILAGGGLLFLLLRGLVRKARFNKAISNTDDAENPANYAQRIHNAFNPDTMFGWGTDEELLRRTVQAVPHRKFWDKVKVEYHKLTRGRNLMEDMAGELSRQEKREIDLILSMLPENQREADNRDPNRVTEGMLSAWAERIKQAADYETGFLWPYGTDEEAIHAVLRELPTAAALCDLNRIYRRMYGKGVLTELTDEMSGSDLLKAYQIITSKSDAQGKTISEIINRCD